MKDTRYIPLALVLILAFGVLSLTAGEETPPKQTTPEEPKEIKWLSFDKGLAALDTDSTEKHIFVDITASWCGWCKKMEREAFADPKVISLINQYFIPVKLWGDSKNELEINGYRISEQALAKSEFNVSGFPTFWFVSPDKARIGPLRGYQTTDNLLKALTWVKDFEYDTTRVKAPDKKEQTKK